ncbi:hypothetical protein VNO77_02217 [Canavalia gladiata]|uniref:Uncharacterized protein n=1 Tax=Canavalia gladiata TaxID=3824 RepID=A0AAN9MXR2_CANGL
MEVRLTGLDPAPTYSPVQWETQGSRSLQLMGSCLNIINAQQTYQGNQCGDVYLQLTWLVTLYPRLSAGIRGVLLEFFGDETRSVLESEIPCNLLRRVPPETEFCEGVRELFQDSSFFSAFYQSVPQ